MTEKLRDEERHAITQLAEQLAVLDDCTAVQDRDNRRDLVELTNARDELHRNSDLPALRDRLEEGLTVRLKTASLPVARVDFSEFMRQSETASKELKRELDGLLPAWLSMQASAYEVQATTMRNAEVTARLLRDVERRLAPPTVP